MDVISIIGVSRGNEYSPNHVDNDAAIFYKVTEELRRLGCEVKVYAEKDFVEQGVKGDIIFDMARDKVTIARLRSLEDEGALVTEPKHVLYAHTAIPCFVICLVPCPMWMNIQV